MSDLVDFGEPWKLSGVEGRVLVDRSGVRIGELRFAREAVRQRVAACVNAVAGIASPDSWVMDCLVLIRPLARYFDEKGLADKSPDTRYTLQGVPYQHFARAAANIAGASGLAGRGERAVEALWEALVALGAPVSEREAIATAVAILRLGLERAGDLGGVNVAQ